MRTRKSGMENRCKTCLHVSIASGVAKIALHADKESALVKEFRRKCDGVGR